MHFEIIGKDAKKLRSYNGDLFGWELVEDDECFAVRADGGGAQPDSDRSTVEIHGLKSRRRMLKARLTIKVPLGQRWKRAYDRPNL